MRRTILLIALAASTMLTVATCARANDTNACRLDSDVAQQDKANGLHRHADCLPVSAHVCRGVVTQTSDAEPENAIKIGECYLYRTNLEYKRVIAVCHMGDTCQFRAKIVGMAGSFVERIFGPVRAIGPGKPLHKFVCPGSGFCD
jgi:hypothetical protein